MTGIAYIRGQYVPEDQATINIRTHAFLYGTSLFEGIRGYWNESHEAIYLFRAREHFERLLKNANLIFLESPLDLDGLMEVSCELVKKNAYRSNVYIQPRLYKSGFVMPPRLEDIESDICYFMLPMGDYLDTEKGLNVCVSSWRRISDNAIPPRGKISGAYVNSGLAMAEAHMNGFDDCILLSESGYVSEGSGMNLFMVRNGVLITPSATENILEGITRGSVIELAQNELGLRVEERAIQRTELYVADEVFFTGTAAQIAHVSKIDHRPIGSEKAGPITQQLQTLYDDVVHGNVPKYSHWLTEVAIHAACC